ncbi:ribonuclease HI [Deltaproteobacteria bacterium TL4]
MEPKKKRPYVKIYTDGACSPNPGIGGWGSVLISPQHKNHRKEISGAEAESTNNRMELRAAIAALQQLKSFCIVDLYTDSAYVCNAFRKGWIFNWKKNGWKTTDKKPVLNQDLWETLYELSKQHEITWNWVKGHANNPENNRCDELAVQAREQIRDQLRK